MSSKNKAMNQISLLEKVIVFAERGNSPGLHMNINFNLLKLLLTFSGSHSKRATLPGIRLGGCVQPCADSFPSVTMRGDNRSLAKARLAKASPPVITSIGDKRRSDAKAYTIFLPNQKKLCTDVKPI
jgi:hypothetical protein